jgi:hypothetical protein
VTTGKGPAAVGGAKPGDTSQAAVTARAQTLFNQTNTYYQQQSDHPNSALQAAAPPGYPTSGIAVADRLLTPVTGSTYHYQPLNDAADRQAALPKIEAAAEAGKPVPIDVETPPGTKNPAAHQMIIEDYQNGELEIYNPWGDTQWIPAKQFLDGNVGAPTGGDLPVPIAVQLPQQ